MRAFISYSHHDKEVLTRLHVHLANLRRENLIQAWYDREILAGAVLEDEIRKELESADLFLLLVSPDFIASDYCVEQEMQRALERHARREAWVVPIIIEPCEWAAMPQLRRLKAVPTDGVPVSEWPNANNAYLNVVEEIRRIVDAVRQTESEPARSGRSEAAPQQGVPRYRVKRDFDDIDRSEYCDSAFAAIKDYFQRAIGEINAVDGLRGRFVDRGANSFGGTVVNNGRQRGTAHITVYCRTTRFELGDIYYSFSENAGKNRANGVFSVSSDDYEQFLEASFTMFGNESNRLNPEQAAEHLWNEFIEQAGITHA